MRFGQEHNFFEGDVFRKEISNEKKNKKKMIKTNFFWKAGETDIFQTRKDYQKMRCGKNFCCRSNFCGEYSTKFKRFRFVFEKGFFFKKNEKR